MLTRLLLVALLAAPVAASAQEAPTSEAPPPRAIKLNNGDTVSGTLVEETDASITLRNDALGTFEVDRADVADDNVNPPPKPTALDAYIDGLAEDLDSVLFPGWEKSIALGLNGSEGNTETINLYADFATGYEDDSTVWDISGRYFRASEDGEATQNQARLTVDREWHQPDWRHFYFGSLIYTYDQFTDYENRVGAYGGVGYGIWEGPVHTLDGRVGVGGIYEFGDVNEFTPEMFIGLDYAWKIDANQRFTASNYLYPALDPAFGRYRNVATLDYRVKLAAADGLSLKIGALHEYRSEVSNGDKSADLNYYAALQMDF